MTSQSTTNLQLNNSDTIRGWGYIRLVEDTNSEPISLWAQTKTILALASDLGIELADVFEDTNNGTLTFNQRDGLSRLLLAIQPADWIFIYQLYQNEDLGLYRDLVIHKQCVLICLKPLIDSRTQEGRDALGITEKLLSRKNTHLRRLADEGKLICRPPFGWTQDSITHEYLPIPEQQQVVLLMKRWYMCGVKPSEIAIRLNDEGKAYTLNLNKKTPISKPCFTNTNVKGILRGNHILMDDKTPVYSYEQRVANWNSNKK